MKNCTITASIVLSALLMGAAAHPMHHHRRALKVVTVTQEVVEVEYVTSTVYVDPETSTAASVVVPTTSAVLTTSSFTPAIMPIVTPAAVETPTSTTPVVAPTSTTPVQVFAAPVPSTTRAPVVVSTPAPTPTPEAEPTTSTTPVVVATPTPTPAAVDSVSSGSSSTTGRLSGDGTFYSAGLGSCGITSSDTDMIAALGIITMDKTNPGNPNNNPVCGKKVKAFSASNTEGVVVTIVDTCAGCAGASDLDFSPAAFDQLGAEASGRIPITWEWL